MKQVKVCGNCSDWVVPLTDWNPAKKHYCLSRKSDHGGTRKDWDFGCSKFISFEADKTHNTTENAKLRAGIKEGAQG